MAFITADRVKDTSTTTGTGNITVSGSAPFGYRTFSTVLSVGDTFYYCIQGQGTAEWEVGLGTYASTNQFDRTTVLASSASGSKVSFSSGTKNVFITLPANKTLQFDASGSPTAGGILYGTGSMLSYSAVGTAGQVLVSGGSGAPTWSTVTGLGTVTSVNVSGGTTGLTASGGPVTTSGTITLAGTLAAANGGTGLTSPGANGNVLTSNGSAWVSQTPSGGSGTSISNGTSNVTIASSNGAITAATAGTTAMTIDTSQNVGIGTSSPGAKLQVNGIIQTGATGTNGNIQFLRTSDGAAASSISWDSANTALAMNNGVGTGVLTFLTNSTERMRIDSSGNVGIGTSSPTYKLDVSTASATDGLSINLTNSGSTGAGINFSQSGVDTFFMSMPAGTGGLRFVASGSNERMRIDSSGNLLVGTTSQIGGQGKFVINVPSGWGQAIQVANTSTQGILTTNTSGTGTYNAMGFYNNGTTFSFCGGITVSGSSTSFNTSSDYRLKENVTPMTTGLATIGALKPVTYDWISDKSQGEGFIAHELQEVIPLAVTGAKDAVDDEGNIKSQGVDCSKIVVHLVAALQELSAKNDALEARLAALEAK